MSFFRYGALVLALLLALTGCAFAREEILDDEPFMTGTVYDATMNTIVVTASDGFEYMFSKNDATDMSGLKDGLLIGNRVIVTYFGTVDWEKHDASGVRLLSVSDAVSEEGTFQTVALSEETAFKADLDGDGTEETLTLSWLPGQWEDELDYALTVTDAKGNAVTFVTEILSSGSALLADLDPEDGMLSVLLTGDVMSDDYCTWCLNYQDGMVSLRACADGEPGMPLPGQAVACVDGVLKTESWVNLLGTWGGSTTWQLNENGEFMHVPGAMWFYAGALDAEAWTYHAITVKKELPVKLYGEFELEDGVLAVGTRILPEFTDQAGEYWFVTEDGREGMLQYEDSAKGWGVSINGVDEAEWFEFLPYAG